MADPLVTAREARARQLVAEHWGIPAWRDYRPGPRGGPFGQADVVRAVLQGRDVLTVIPTGGGKSLLYQIPALVLAERQDRPLSIVITPLQALMYDQVAGLRRRGFQGVAARTGADTAAVRRQTMQQVERGEIWLLFLAPEQLDNPRVRAALRQRALGLVAIDEAHCVAEWGHDFRLAYARLATHLRGPDGLLADRDVPILAVTATARTAPEGEGDTVDEVHTMLGLRPDACVWVADTTRAELTWEARVLPDVDETAAADARAIERLPTPWRRGGDWSVRAPAIATALRDAAADGKAIVYVLWARDAALLARWLADELGRPTLWYTGQDTTAHRAEALTAFQEPCKGPTAPVLVATTAFGMGVDVPDVAAVIHANAPASPEAWSQEVGRGARGPGRTARGIAVWHPQDLVRQATMVRRGRVEEATLATLLSHVRACVAQVWPTRTVLLPPASLCRVLGWEEDATDRVVYALSLLCLARCSRGHPLLERLYADVVPDAPIAVQWLAKSATTPASLAPALAHDARRSWGQACRQRRVREALRQSDEARQAWIADWFAGRVPFRHKSGGQRPSRRSPQRRNADRTAATWTGVSQGPARHELLARLQRQWVGLPIRNRTRGRRASSPVALRIFVLAVRDASIEAAAADILDLSHEAAVAPWGATTRVLATRILQAAQACAPNPVTAGDGDAAPPSTRELLRAATARVRVEPVLPLVHHLRTSGVRVWIPDAQHWDEDHVGLLRAIWGQQGWDATAVLGRQEWRRGVPGRLARVWELAGAVEAGPRGTGVAWSVVQGPRYAGHDRASVLRACGVDVREHHEIPSVGDAVAYRSVGAKDPMGDGRVATFFGRPTAQDEPVSPLGLVVATAVDAQRWRDHLDACGYCLWHADTWRARAWAQQVGQQHPALSGAQLVAQLCLAAPGPVAPDALSLLAAWCRQDEAAHRAAVVWRAATEVLPRDGLPAEVTRWLVCWPAGEQRVDATLVDALAALPRPIVWVLARRRFGWHPWRALRRIYRRG